MSNIRSRVTTAIEAILKRDKKLGQELQDKRAGGVAEEGRFHMTLESLPEGRADIDPGLVMETIVLRTGRPVLAVSRDEPQLTFDDAESEVWRERLVQARTQVGRAIRASGRIELENHALDWVGTGWLVRPDIIVTNRHVAEAFGRRSGDGFVFRTGFHGRTIAASIDFLEEFGRPESLSFKLREILHIEPDRGPDVAFLRVVPSDGTALAEPLTLASSAVAEDRLVAVIGYPARDSRIPEIDLMERIFGNVFDKKRLAPGQITRRRSNAIEHDCSTLGGNSGSVVLDLETGQAAGIHFAGRFLDANFAVPAALVAERIDRVLRGAGGRTTVATPTSALDAVSPSTPLRSSGCSVTCTIPVRVTVEIGGPGSDRGQTTTVSTVPSASPPDIDEDDDDELFETEARPEDYVDRKGYDLGFLGSGTEVPMPEVVQDADQIVSFQFDGDTDIILRYEHFSVVMNRERRLCFYSAANIDGGLSRKAKRPGWRLDPRIPTALQIQKECYGNAPKFSRGHMTRREDPIWGTKTQAERGNSDSMHVTNAVPQMQVFNAGIWLGLEDYALDNCREDEMRICVITGPVFRNRDPIRFGVKIPSTFWKVIAFIHDETGEISATGYSISQDQFLEEREFVFGAYETFQRSLAWIERQAGVSFGSLTAQDAFESLEEAAPAPLRDFRQIRFFR